MSLNKILASAQKLGMPVVITDRNGDNAQVVMPFDDFLALSDAATGEGKRGVASGALDDLDLDDFPEEPDMDFSVGDLDSEIQAEMERAETETPPLSGFNGMEEKFYLEPLDDDKMA